MKKKETLFFIQVILFFLFSWKVNASKAFSQKSKFYPTFPEDQYNYHEKIELRGPWFLYPNKLIKTQRFTEETFEANFFKVDSHNLKNKLTSFKFGVPVYEVKAKKDESFIINTNNFLNASEWFYLEGGKSTSIQKNGSVGYNFKEENPGNKTLSLKITPFTNKSFFVVHTSNYTSKKKVFKKRFPSITKVNEPSPKLISSLILLGILISIAVFSIILFFMKSEKYYLYFFILTIFSIFWSLLELNYILYFTKNSALLSIVLTKLKLIFFMGLNVANLYFIQELLDKSQFLEKKSKLILYFSVFASIIFFLIPLSSLPKNAPMIYSNTYSLIIYSFILVSCYHSFKKDFFARCFTFFFIVVLFYFITLLIMNNYFLEHFPLYMYLFICILTISQKLILILKDINREKSYINQRNQLRDIVPSIKDQLENEMTYLNSIFEEINEVILSLDSKGIVKKETSSKLSKKVFGESLKDKSILDTVFLNVEGKVNFFEELKNNLDSSKKLDLKEWIKIKKELPEKVIFSKNKKEKTLSIKYGELFDEKTSKIKEILLIIQDITNIEKILENEIRISRRNIIISELVPEKGRNLEKHKENLSNFFRESRLLISNSSKLASSKSVDTINAWDQEFIWKNVNTVKSNSKFIGLKGISSRLNEEEQKFLKLKPKKGKLSDDMILEICSSLLAIIEVISDYETTAEEIFGLSTDTKKSIETSYIEIEKLDMMDKKIKLLSKKVDIDEMNEVTKEWSKLFKSSLLELLKGFESLVDLTSKELGKSTSYRVGGDDIYLKENVLSKISDSVIHLLRNSIDHGIELPKERNEAGKEKKGSIDIKCVMLESSFQLSIKDDGAGIDHDLLIEKAIANKIIGKEDYDKMLDSEKIELIFKEGFTSKDEANKISGRGLGMDIIKKNIESLGGKIKINTKKSQGTEFILTLPFKSEKS